MSFAFFVCSLIFLLVSIVLVIVAKNARSEPTGWAGVIVGLVSLACSLYFGIQSHADAQAAAKPKPTTTQHASPPAVEPPSTQNNETRGPTSVPTAATGGIVPKGMIGTWEGTQEQPGYGTYTAIVTLRNGSLGQVVGASNYPGLKCSGALTLTEADPIVIVEENITNGPGANCVLEDEFRMQLNGDDRLYLEIYIEGKRVSWGTLKRRS